MYTTSTPPRCCLFDMHRSSEQKLFQKPKSTCGVGAILCCATSTVVSLKPVGPCSPKKNMHAPTETHVTLKLRHLTCNPFPMFVVDCGFLNCGRTLLRSFKFGWIRRLNIHSVAAPTFQGLKLHPDWNANTFRASGTSSPHSHLSCLERWPSIGASQSIRHHANVCRENSTAGAGTSMPCSDDIQSTLGITKGSWSIDCMV